MINKIENKLACRYCAVRWPDKTVMEAVKLHFQVDHDTDDVQLDLVHVCQCGDVMENHHTVKLHSGTTHYLRCPGCGRQGSVKSG